MKKHYSPLLKNLPRKFFFFAANRRIPARTK